MHSLTISIKYSYISKNLMNYDENFWKKYADENEVRYNEEFAKFTKDLAISLRCTSVLEVGCGTGIDLRLFPETFQIYGADPNEYALDIAKEKLPVANFKKGIITDLPFEDSSIDFVFTHGLLNYLDDDTLEKGIAEMYRVTGKYIMNCETFSDVEKEIDENQKSRNMVKRWMNYKVRIVSDVDMHEDIEPEKKRFVLLRKI
ncbi:Methyltransferase type 11 [Nitrosopumilus piranensis]|uniref:Methyltransferase type 11 n=2 Tax=Nitrosopumilus piranensis TaxID=1582439 RepID=A0A0C5BTZ7_9ARCH|nr:Methyltransferase type 11 [Nitrosopumilus piranensis]